MTPPPRIGIDLGGTKIEGIALDAHGRALWRKRVPTPAGNYQGTIATVAQLVQQCEADLGVRDCRVGIGTPGTTTADGVIKNANSICLNGRPLATDLAQALGRPVRLANDANCLALSEATDGAGADAGVVFAVILGTGVGGGIVVGKRVHEGPNGIAGEWGHNPLPWRGDDESQRPCYCGRSGCIETFLSGAALARDHEDREGGQFTGAQLDASAKAGDVGAQRTWRRYESRLARALASVINLLDPEVIVLGGGVSNVERLYSNVPTLWSEHVFSGGVKDTVLTRLVRAAHGDSSGVRGAAWLWNESH